VRNEKERIKETLDSLLAQYIRCPIIVVDDASNDGTYEILKKHYANDITLFRNKTHKGGGYSRNLGNSKVTTEYIAVCDADLYYKDRASVLLKAIKERPDAGVIHTAMNVYNPKHGTFTHECVPIASNFLETCEGRKKIPIRHPTVCYKTELTKEFKYPDDSKETDGFEYFFLNLVKYGIIFYAVPVETMLFYAGTSKRNKVEAEKKRIEHYKAFGIEYNK